VSPRLGETEADTNIERQAYEGGDLWITPARVILLRPASWPKHGFGVWLARAAQRLHPNVLAAALANKLARIAWTVLAQERSYETRLTKAAA
jgi:transposase